MNAGPTCAGGARCFRTRAPVATRSAHFSHSFHPSESVQLRAVETKVRTYGMYDGLMTVDREISDRQGGAQATSKRTRTVSN